MIDSFGREITYLRLSVTELCNLRCRYCMPAEGVCKKQHSDMLTQEETVLAVEAAATLGIRKVRITGGEPLVKPNIVEICREVAAVPGIEEVCITTNGILLPRYARALRDAGVRRVNISLDTLNGEKYAHITRIGKLEEALWGLTAALAAGFERVKINVVLMGGVNDDEIPALAELTKLHPVDVRFIELMPMGCGGEFGGDAFISCDKVLEVLPELAPVEGPSGVARLYRLPGAQGDIGLISPISQNFCGSCDRIRLTADGFVLPCLHAPDSYSIKGLGWRQMVAKMREAILAKPPCHGELSALCPSEAEREMNRIGG